MGRDRRLRRVLDVQRQLARSATIRGPMRTRPRTDDGFGKATASGVIVVLDVEASPLARTHRDEERRGGERWTAH